jgi:hypothetical protein
VALSVPVEIDARPEEHRAPTQRWAAAVERAFTIGVVLSCLGGWRVTYQQGGTPFWGGSVATPRVLAGAVIALAALAADRCPRRAPQRPAIPTRLPCNAPHPVARGERQQALRPGRRRRVSARARVRRSGRAARRNSGAQLGARRAADTVTLWVRERGGGAWLGGGCNAAAIASSCRATVTGLAPGTYVVRFEDSNQGPSTQAVVGTVVIPAHG